MKDFTVALEALADGGVDFIIVGGIAAVLHGAARPTYDLDIVYARTPENLTRLVELGDLDLLGEVAGGGRFEDLVKHTQQVEMLGRTFSVVTLEGLIRLKTAAGRSKDLDALAELEALREERDR